MRDGSSMNGKRESEPVGSCTDADDIAATETANEGGMSGTGWDIAAFTRAIEMGFTVHDKRHFPAQDDVSCFVGMNMLGIICVRAVSPNVRVRKAFALELLCNFLLVHHSLVPLSLIPLSTKSRFPKRRRPQFSPHWR